MAAPASFNKLPFEIKCMILDLAMVETKLISINTAVTAGCIEFRHSQCLRIILALSGHSTTPVRQLAIWYLVNRNIFLAELFTSDAGLQQFRQNTRSLSSFLGSISRGQDQRLGLAQTPALHLISNQLRLVVFEDLPPTPTGIAHWLTLFVDRPHPTISNVDDMVWVDRAGTSPTFNFTVRDLLRDGARSVSLQRRKLVAWLSELTVAYGMPKAGDIFIEYLASMAGQWQSMLKDNIPDDIGESEDLLALLESERTDIERYQSEDAQNFLADEDDSGGETPPTEAYRDTADSYVDEEWALQVDAQQALKEELERTQLEDADKMQALEESYRRAQREEHERLWAHVAEIISELGMNEVHQPIGAPPN